MFLRNAWYVAAWAHELDSGPLARTIMDEPVVFWRGADGTVTALEDACAHRHAPLSLGTLLDGGARVRCPYHGLEFDRGGACVHVPGQARVPPGARVRAYPAAERWRWIWIWPGDPALADPALIPDFHWNDDPGWAAVGGYFHVKGDWRLLVENLLDLTHVAYVHTSTLATEKVAHWPIKARRKADGSGVLVDRWIFDEPAPPMFRKVGDFDGPVDRWQLIDYTAPGHFAIDVGCARPGTGATEGDRTHGITLFSNHSVTPESAGRSHYFWHHARDFRRDDAALTVAIEAAASEAFGEDVVIIEAQQDRIDRARPGRPVVDINADAGVMLARRVLEEKRAAEAGASATADSVELAAART